MQVFSWVFWCIYKCDPSCRDAFTDFVTFLICTNLTCTFALICRNNMTSAGKVVQCCLFPPDKQCKIRPVFLERPRIRVHCLINRVQEKIIHRTRQMKYQTTQIKRWGKKTGTERRVRFDIFCKSGETWPTWHFHFTPDPNICERVFDFWAVLLAFDVLTVKR